MTTGSAERVAADHELAHSQRTIDHTHVTDETVEALVDRAAVFVAAQRPRRAEP